MKRQKAEGFTGGSLQSNYSLINPAPRDKKPRVTGEGGFIYTGKGTIFTVLTKFAKASCPEPPPTPRSAPSAPSPFLPVGREKGWYP